MRTFEHNTRPDSPHIDRNKLDKLPILPPLDLGILPPFPHKPTEKQPRRSVCFDEASNEIHTFERVTEEELEDVWYCSKDYEYFRWDRKQLAAALQLAEASYEEEDSWSQAVLRVYCAFRQYEDPADLQDILESTSLEMDEYTVGLEKYLLPPIGRDYAVRRQHLVEQFRHLQQCKFNSDEQRENLLRDTSRLASRAARLFAQFVGQTSAATLD